MGAGVPNLPRPSFVADANGLDPNKVLSDMISQFEAASGRTLQPAQVERLLINLYAYRESLVRDAIQFAGEQTLLAFAVFPMIDYIGQLLGVTRLPAQGAVTTLQFTLQNPLSLAYTIPAGTQAGTSDGQFIFATDSNLTIPAGTTSGTVSATCTTAGSAANGYLAGQVNALLSPDVLIAAVTNVETTGGGAEPETDDHLRARIQTAPNEFSVAGPAGAYRFFALGADPSIIDVEVISPVPGTVNIYVLTGPITIQPASAPNSAAIANSALLAKVEGVLSADNVRPLTDTVNALAVSEVDYQIAGTVTLFADADPIATMDAVNAAAQSFALNLASRIQRDIVPSEIVAALSVSGVYQVVLTAPVYTQLSAGQWANCTSIALAQATAAEHS
ncbi:MAG TPA: baseplate J/gp47 family protein [Candidatus Binataceae bacterium]|jgi:phage-related baseplate assembly protein|nr:baseplate J/gp47 family protein [Candidatus Binataceae bacterium]